MSSFKRVWTDMHIHIHIYIYIFLNSWNPKMGKLPNFGVDMFFLKLLESKKWKKILVLVLTDWNLEPSAYTRIEGKIWKCKVAPKNNVFFQKGLNRHAYTHTYIYISQLLESKRWENCLIFGVDMFFLKLLESKKWKKYWFWCWHVFLKLLESKKWENLYTSFGVDMFSQTPGVQKMGKIY